MPMSSSGSRSGRLARISQSNIRPFGSGTIGGGGTGPGGHPLAGAECSSPMKKDSRHRFEIVRKLGSGTYGKVSLAYDHKFDREVAVKLIKKSAIENKADLVRIRREIRIMSALNHPNIIQIFEVFENKEKIILVMEYANGGELYDYVSKMGSLPEQEARRIFRQITSAVLYCHKHKVAHRDLKLENILLDGNSNAKIADFGLSNYFSDKAQLNTFCGSPLYASPEIINGTPYRGPEVDCWSLGILLYTLVYGSMPFDGRDFNRMVRQIKRGAYYEPDTPSTASMLIRNMLRVNPDRRANIDDIASHWWLNLEENMPVIQELPENRILDHTPLTERAETMIVQELLDEADVFMEFSHLSSETRRKIEEFRRRRKEAEAFNETCPVQPKTRKTDETVPEMKAEDKSLRGVKDKTEKTADDPLERLKQIETRLGNITERRRQSKDAADMQPPAKKEPPPIASPASPVSMASTTSSTTTSTSSSRRPTSAAAWRVETDSLNMLMNQVLEQMEKGPVSLNLVARIKAHPLYDSRPMVKELLESILAGQPETIQKQTSKIMEQNQSQEVVRRNSIKKDERESAKKSNTIVPEKTEGKKRQHLEDRKWHSVEVGFEDEGDDDDSVSSIKTGSHKDDVMSVSAVSNVTEITVRESSFEDMDEDRAVTPTPKSKKDEEVEDEEEDDEYSDSELEELAEEVEQVDQSQSGKPGGMAAPIPQTPGTPKATAPPALISPQAPPAADLSGVPPQFLDAFDRGLFKRQSKGKYQHIIIDLYGRGLSLDEHESPLFPRRRIGGPQPSIEHSPFLFDKARQCIMQFPNRLNLEDEEKKPRRKKKKPDELCIVEVDVNEGHSDASSGGPPQSRHNGSVPPRTPPPLEESEEEDEDEEEGSEEESEEEEEVFMRRPGPPVIGGRIIGTPRTIAEVSTQPSMQQAPVTNTTLNQAPPTQGTVVTEAEISPIRCTSPPDHEPIRGSKFAVTVAELDPKKQNTRPIAVVGPNVESTSLCHESDYENDEIYACAGEVKERESVLGPESPDSQQNENQEESWQAAAASLKRRNMERRRARNHTIGVPEEIIRAAERDASERRAAQVQQVQSHLHDRESDPFYTQHFAGGGLRVRLHEDSFRRRQSELDNVYSTGTRINSAAVVREDRGKSRSYHDPSPDRPDLRLGSSYAGSAGGSNLYGGASPSYTRKFDDASLSWAHEPRKFEVYKTRAERDAEKHTLMHTGVAPGASPSSAYRTSYYTDARPSANYYRPKSVYDEGSSGSSYAMNTHSTRPTSMYHERSTTPSYGDSPLTVAAGDAGINELLARYTEYGSHNSSYGRPSTRRVPGFSDTERAPYTRSRSIDRKASLDDDLRGRLTTPEVSSNVAPQDYAYVHYHDTAFNAGRASQPRTMTTGETPKSILKNKQSAEFEPRASVPESVGPVRSVIDRLKRHLSLEKSPPLPTPTTRAPSTGPAARAYVAPTTIGMTTGGYEDGKKKTGKAGSSTGMRDYSRRRTSELRLGGDGSILTNGYTDLPSGTSPFRFHDDSSYSRSTVGSRGREDTVTGIDKIKSLFSGRKESGSSASRAYTPGGTSYPMSNVAASTTASTRDPYGSGASSYRSSYLGGASPASTTHHHPTSSVALSRYGGGYSAGSSDARRFYDYDHH